MEKVKENLITTQFTRIEDKFIIPLNLRSELTYILDKHMQLSPESLNGEGFYVQSIYFDSNEVDFFRHHFEKHRKRSKIRIRRYGNVNTRGPALTFLECKSKVDGISFKNRLLLTAEELFYLYGGREITVTPQLIKANPTIEVSILNERVSKINFLVKEYKLLPRIQIEYQRVAYEAQDLRVTLDKNIQLSVLGPASFKVAQSIKKQDYWFQAEQMHICFSNEYHFLLEVKHTGHRPQWLEDWVVDKNLLSTSFSKYCWGMEQALDQAANIETVTLALC